MGCGVELVEQTSRSLCIHNFSFGSMRAAFACAALSLHVGIQVLQGVNFLDYWAPALLVFVFGGEGELGADVVGGARAGFEASPWCFGAALAFTVVQCCCVLFLVDISSGTRDLLPWSCMPLSPEIRALANPSMLGLPFVHAANFEVSPELLDEAKGLIDALRLGEGIDALLARHEEVMREFRLDAVYDHKDD